MEFAVTLNGTVSMRRFGLGKYAVAVNILCDTISSSSRQSMAAQILNVSGEYKLLVLRSHGEATKLQE